MIKSSKYILYISLYLLIQEIIGGVFIVLLGLNKNLRLLEHDWKVAFANIFIMIVLFIVLRKHINRYINQLSFSIQKIGLYFLIGIIYSTIFNFIFIEIYGGDFSLKPHNKILLSSILSIVLIGPIAEEIIFRVIPVEYLLKKEVSKNWIIFFTSLFFSLVHLPNWYQVIATFLLGLLCSIIYTKERNLLYPIIIHFIYNAFSVFIG
ncbi:CPBP family intramembrane glutamic endopeptidase [Chryseobacterium salviniae]|uniref:Type II CAAX endopeptidase family protein n=1 Tax=Chryseobacterium salviniae TaxID=3101750 RepID=A0ABU6HSA9_9FLAO|nr:type II CAAX endopeptidase family protein [Chryseobacterium sp. T9W2-O]MEC3875333.1 type II CAAX endopeptidase family protein [Chryseobacterium sp. T9W2-O]